MNIRKAATLILMGVTGVLGLVNCRQKTTLEPAPQARDVEQAGAALDPGAEKSAGDASPAVNKTGEALERAGAAVENAGEELRN